MWLKKLIFLKILDDLFFISFIKFLNFFTGNFMAVCITCWAIMENPLSCEDLSEDTLCAVDPKIDTKKIWKYKFKIDYKIKKHCGMAQKKVTKNTYISDTPIWSFTVIIINPKKAAYLPAKRKTNSTGTFSLELNCFFFLL